MAEWYLDLEQKDWQLMLQTAMYKEPNDILYQWGYYSALDLNITKNKIIAAEYAHLIEQRNPMLMEKLHEKGSLGEYILDCMKGWSKQVLNQYPYNKL